MTNVFKLTNEMGNMLTFTATKKLPIINTKYQLRQLMPTLLTAMKDTNMFQNGFLSVKSVHVLWEKVYLEKDKPTEVIIEADFETAFGKLYEVRFLAQNDDTELLNQIDEIIDYEYQRMSFNGDLEVAEFVLSQEEVYTDYNFIESTDANKIVYALVNGSVKEVSFDYFKTITTVDYGKQIFGVIETFESQDQKEMSFNNVAKEIIHHNLANGEKERTKSVQELFNLEVKTKVDNVAKLQKRNMLTNPQYKADLRTVVTRLESTKANQVFGRIFSNGMHNEFNIPFRYLTVNTANANYDLYFFLDVLLVVDRNKYTITNYNMANGKSEFAKILTQHLPIANEVKKEVHKDLQLVYLFNRKI